MWCSSLRINIRGLYKNKNLTRDSQTRRTQFSKQMQFFKCIFLVSCIIFVFIQVWVKVQTSTEFNYNLVHRNVKFDPGKLKYILLWSLPNYAPFSFMYEGQTSFIKKKCLMTNCYVTGNRTFFGSDYTKFDAIAFNGRKMNPGDLPGIRSDHQKYIYFNMESSVNYPVCNPKYDGYFNWTATYKLDSDIPFPYILIKDKRGDIVGPKRDMSWIKDMEKVEDDRINNKTKAAAWFVSNCRSRSDRLNFVKKLQDALHPYGSTVDIYGKCGNFTCPRNKQADCDLLLEKDYFFYMSLENTFAEDYVTEKLLTALKNNVVPVVYGGADYSRFLPPGSYIDGRKQDIKQTAAIMDKLVHSPQEYSQFFRWKHYYSYHNPSEIENVCRICEALNNSSIMQKSTVYKNFRSWWNPDYESRCRTGTNQGAFPILSGG